MGFSKASQMRTMAAVLLAAAAAAVVLMSGAAATDEKLCMTSVVSLMPCLPFTENKVPAPTAACCRNLAQVVQDNPQCLCAVLDGEAAQWLGIPVDVNRALALPPTCSVKTPPSSRCNSTAAPPSASSTPSPAMAPNYSDATSAAAFTKSNILPSCAVGLVLLPALLRLPLAGF